MFRIVGGCVINFEFAIGDYECSQCDSICRKPLLWCPTCDYVRCGPCVVLACRFRSFPMHLGGSFCAAVDAVLEMIVSDDLAAIAALGAFC